jgi:hypothetical protein
MLSTMTAPEIVEQIDSPKIGARSAKGEQILLTRPGAAARLLGRRGLAGRVHRRWRLYVQPFDRTQPRLRVGGSTPPATLVGHRRSLADISQERRRRAGRCLSSWCGCHAVAVIRDVPVEEVGNQPCDLLVMGGGRKVAGVEKVQLGFR